MNTKNIEDYEFNGPNVQFVTDDEGRGHYCESAEDGSMAGGYEGDYRYHAA